MDVRDWAAALQLLLADLEQVDFGYPLGSNELFPPQSEFAVDESLIMTNLNTVGILRELYLVCDGFSLPDIHNGYFLKSIHQLSQLRPGDPIRVTGAFAGQVHPSARPAEAACLSCDAYHMMFCIYRRAQSMTVSMMAPASESRLWLQRLRSFWN